MVVSCGVWQRSHAREEQSRENVSEEEDREIDELVVGHSAEAAVAS
jgi:hypothetical protein